MASFKCNNRPSNGNSRLPLEKGIEYKPFLLQLGLSSRHEVCTYCCAGWPLNLRLCSHSRKDRYGELHVILGIINSPTLRSSWTQVSSAQRERPTFLIKCSDFSMRQCSGGFVWDGGRRVSGFAKVWEECSSFQSQVWRAVKGPSL